MPIWYLLFPAWMFGDPHITTLDQVSYTFNGLGDFLLVQAQDGNSSFLLQGRTAQTGSAQASNFIAFAAQYNSSGLAPITVSEAGDTRHLCSPPRECSGVPQLEIETQEEEERRRERGRREGGCVLLV